MYTGTSVDFDKTLRSDSSVYFNLFSLFDSVERLLKHHSVVILSKVLSLTIVHNGKLLNRLQVYCSKYINIRCFLYVTNIICIILLHYFENILMHSLDTNSIIQTKLIHNFN